MFGLEWHSEMQALCSRSLQILFSCPLRTCSLLMQPSGKKAALTNNVWDEAKPWKKWLKRRDNPWSYSKCTFSKSHSAAWEGQCLTSYKARHKIPFFSFIWNQDSMVDRHLRFGWWSSYHIISSLISSGLYTSKRILWDLIYLCNTRYNKLIEVKKQQYVLFTFSESVNSCRQQWCFSCTAKLY